jgi:hypothetical protein
MLQIAIAMLAGAKWLAGVDGGEVAGALVPTFLGP